MLKEFKEFISRGNLIDLAVAVVLGLAFSAVVQALVADVISPLIAAVFGQPDFSNIKIDIGDSAIFIGSFLNALISFVIVAFVLFLVVKAYNRAFPKEDEEAGRARRSCSPRSGTSCGSADFSVSDEPRGIGYR